MYIYQMFKNDIKKNIQIPYVDLPNIGFPKNLSSRIKKKTGKGRDR